MSELLAPLSASPEILEEPEVTAASVVAPAPVGPNDETVLITEQEVLFATAAAVPLQPVTTRSWASRFFGAVVASVTAGNDERPKPRHYPSRNDFLEDSRMAREMHRL
jgi:hypothetical protein